MSNLSRAFKLAVALSGGVVCMSISDNASSLRQASLVTTADARVGRPLTPMSVAGVARRTTRRAVVRGRPSVPTTTRAVITAPTRALPIT